MKTIKLFCIVLLVSSFSSCNKDLAVDTSARADFDLFFEYLAQDYAYRDYHDFTINELREQYLPEIEASSTQTTLANIMFNVINNDLKDPHNGINSDEPLQLITASIENPLEVEESAPDFFKVDILGFSDFYSWGLIKNNSNIGYIYVRAFNLAIGGSSSLGIEDGVIKINTIIKDLNSRGVTSMIVDIRSEAGGSNYVPRYIAQRFADKTSVYMNEYYPVGDGFKRKEWSTSPQGEDNFREGKIALLSNGLTCSGGEFFVLAMLQRDNLIHIGSRSFGCSGNIVEKDLANGWVFQLTNSRTEFPNGDQYFKVGIIPSIIVNNTIDYPFDGSNDKLIERAIEELQ